MLRVHGSGTLNLENKDMEKSFTKELIEKSTRRQEQLLKKALKILKSGKDMIYSTCSILNNENEDIVNKILKETKAEVIPIKLDTLKDVKFLPTKIEGTMCIMPDELYEGFFIAKIRKK